jgi:hypothetical protein
MTNLLQQAINCDAATSRQDHPRRARHRERRRCQLLLPEELAGRSKRRARIIGEWLKTEARYLAS